MDVAASPRSYPLRLDLHRSALGFVPLSEADYVAASFLDERLPNAAGEGDWRPLAEVEKAMSALSAESDFIFHVGHVGSTLLARILGAHPSVFALREPAILRPLATDASDARSARCLPLMLRLYARVWRPEQRSLVKTTSFVTEIAPRILELSPTARAILMFASPQSYLATILAGDASRAELPRVTARRVARLAAQLDGGRLEAPVGDGEMAAAGWTCEILALARAAAVRPHDVLWVDFDRFVADPRAGLTAAMRHLRGVAVDADIDALLASPDFRRYSKATEHPYDAGLRGRILAEAARDFRDEIGRGLAWINRAGGAHPAIAEATRLAAAGRTF